MSADFHNDDSHDENPTTDSRHADGINSGDEHPDHKQHSSWPGFDAVESLRWARVLVRHSPDPQRPGIKAQIHVALERGVPVAGPDWVRTADLARSDGFTPVLYHALFESLRTIRPDAFRSHPGHRKTTFKTYLPGMPYETEIWNDWPRLFLTEGFDAQAATALALLRAEPKFPVNGRSLR